MRYRLHQTLLRAPVAGVAPMGHRAHDLRAPTWRGRLARPPLRFQCFIVCFHAPPLYLRAMPEYRCRPIPQSFIAGREITRDFTPLEFLHCYSQLKHIITTVESDIQDIMYFRGWREYGASSGPECRMRKVFPNGATVETSPQIARDIENMICPILFDQAAKAPPAPPAPARRRRRSQS